jgi:hypothetical protein
MRRHISCINRKIEGVDHLRLASISSFLIITILLTGLIPSSIVQNESLQIMPSDTEIEIDEKAIIDTFEELTSNLIYENKGQIPIESIQFYGVYQGMTFGFGTSEVKIWLSDNSEPLILSFQNSRLTSPEALEKKQYTTNYFIGSDTEFTDINTYSKIIYRDIYERIDLYFWMSDNGLKYEFHVYPGGNPNTIDVYYENADSLSVSSNSLDIQKNNAKLTDDSLYVHQYDNPVHAFFREFGGNSVGFDIETYDKNEILIIDPLLYSTYYGGNDTDTGYEIDTDLVGNIYISGTTYTNFPTYPIGAVLNSTPNGERELFLVKMDPTGSSIIFSTYIGASGVEELFAMDVDDEGNAYLAGYTESTDFPTVNAFDSTYAGSKDAFILKMNSTGNGLDFSTYIGGSGYDGIEAIQVNSSGYVYFTGRTTSADFPIVNGFNSTINGGNDGIFGILGADGDSLNYSTYFGGSGSDDARAIALDSNGAVYITGECGVGFPVINGYDMSINSGSDAYVMQLDPITLDISASTYLGGNSADLGWQIAADDFGLVYLAGITRSTNFPTVDPYDSTVSSTDWYDMFVSILNMTSATLEASTFIGGADNDYPLGIAFNDQGNVYVGGHSESTDFPTVNAYDATYNGGYSDGVIFKFDHSLKNLLYSTFIGGNDYDRIEDMLIDENGTVLASGTTKSLNLPIVNGYNSTYAGGVRDIFIVKLPDMGDSDFDALSDWDELTIGSDRYNNDTDGDLMPDGWEYQYGLNILVNDSLDDNDGDMILNIDEFGYNTNPISNDTDNDEMLDKWEIDFGLNPLVDDSSGDLDMDGLTNLEEYFYSTFPNRTDTDFDTMPDYYEIMFSLDPLTNDTAADLDMDGLLNIEEYNYSTFPNATDTDSDALTDYDEIIIYGSDPLNPDSDQDGLLDGDEIAYGCDIADWDSDDDSVADGAEVYLDGTDPLNDTEPSSQDPYPFSTYIGGLGDDQGASVAVDAYGYVYVAVTTSSVNFPLMHPFDSELNGYDVAVLKFDPSGTVLLYATYIGGSDYERAYEIGIGPRGCVFVAGRTNSYDFPMVNSFDATYNGGVSGDAFVVKLSPAGNQILYSTYYGGGSNDFARAMAIDDQGNAYVTGTGAAGLPMLNAYDSTYSDDGDVFVFKLNQTGGLVYSTYVGGSLAEISLGIDVDDSGFAYVCGYTLSPEFPRVNAVSSFRGAVDAYIFKLGHDGSYLVYSTFYGGSNGDYAYGVAVDSTGSACVTGMTYSSNFPTVNALYPTINHWDEIFVLKLAPAGNSVIFSTYIGGYNDEYGWDVAVDSDDDIYVTGYTNSGDLPMVNALDDTYNGGTDSCVFKLKSDGSEILYSSYLGGSAREIGYSVAVDSQGSAYVVGLTESSNFNHINPYNDTYGGAIDCFLMKIPDLADDDHDELTNYLEVILGTDPASNDTDLDLMLDGWEYLYGLDPLTDDADDDLDSDLLTNLQEFNYNTHPNNTDSDSDNLSDYAEIMDYGTDPLDADSDNDTLLDGYEIAIYTTNPLSNDTDSDLMPDGWEVNNSLDPLLNDSGEDPDIDDLPNLGEYEYGCDPHNRDSDNDTMHDGWEVYFGLNPISNDSLGDLDSDGLTNIEEYYYSTYPNDVDTDHDKLSDYDEIKVYGTDPLDIDTDDDGISDYAEIELGLDPLVPNVNIDSDSDGLTDAQEVELGTDPFHDDSDGDVLSDGDEVLIYGTDPLNRDTDNDTLDDGEEVLVYFTNPLLADTDSDGENDAIEIQYGYDPLVPDTFFDFDRDGLSNEQERILGTNLLDEDTDKDGLLDGWEVARGLDPLHWTFKTGEAQENVNNFLLLGGGIFLVALVALSGMGFISRHKISKLLRSRVILIPAILLLLIFFNTVPMNVEGSTDPGSNSRSSSGTGISLTTKDSPWWGNKVTVTVSLTLSVMFEYCDGTVTVTSGTSTLGTFEFNFGRGVFIERESESGTFTVPKGATVEVRVTYRHYDMITDQNLGGVSFGLSISQSEEDGRNDDQKAWLGIRLQLLALSIGAVILGVVLPTGKVFNYIDKKRDTGGSSSKAKSYQYSKEMHSSFGTMQFGFDDRPEDRLD